MYLQIVQILWETLLVDITFNSVLAMDLHVNTQVAEQHKQEPANWCSFQRLAKQKDI